MEDWKDDLDVQLNGSYGKPGLIRKMEFFFDNQESRTKSLSLKLGILVIVVPVAYDVIKHLLGVK